MTCGFFAIASDTNGTPLDIPIAYGEATGEPDYTVGERTRAYAGNARSTLQSVKRRWNLTTVPLGSTELGAVRAALVPGLALEASGTLFGGGTVEVYVDVIRESYIGARAGILTQLSLLVVEA